MYDIVAIGELLIDFAPVPDQTGIYPVMKANPGGAPANFLAALSKYGAKTAFIGKVGADSFGYLLKNTMEEVGVDTTGMILDDSVFTTLAFVTLDKNGDRSFSFARKPGADTCLTWEEIDQSLLKNTRAVHFGTLSLTNDPARTATQKAIAFAKAQGKMITFDPNLRLPLWNNPEEAKNQILWGLAQADVVKISEEEVDFLWHCNPKEGARKLLEEYGVKLAMVTLGPDGAYLTNGKAAARVKCPKVHPVDTTGAGDIFGGSAIYMLLRSGTAPEELNALQLEAIGQMASTAASLSTEKFGGIPSVPEKKLVEKNLLNMCHNTEMICRIEAEE